MRLGLPELLVVLMVVILIFGAKKIPDLGDALGKAIRNFKKSNREDDAIDVTPRKDPEQLGAKNTATGAPQTTANDAAKKS
jgi:sec-independent protein translocase protein TatA